jgi:hypothetical protein
MLHLLPCLLAIFAAFFFRLRLELCAGGWLGVLVAETGFGGLIEVGDLGFGGSECVGGGGGDGAYLGGGIGENFAGEDWVEVRC